MAYAAHEGAAMMFAMRGGENRHRAWGGCHGKRDCCAWRVIGQRQLSSEAYRLSGKQNREKFYTRVEILITA